MCSSDLVSVNIIDQCVAQGVPFAREYGGLLDNRSFGGAQVSRTFYARGQTGQQLLIGAYQSLMRQVHAKSVTLFSRREMLDLVAASFEEDPNRRWPAMAHATLLAKHRLQDLPLARRYASALQRRATDPTIPLWARQMEVFILEDMNELEAAKIMLGGMLASGGLQDPGERRFLESRLKALEDRLDRKSTRLNSSH